MFSSFGQIAGRSQLLILSLMIFAQGSAFGATIPYLSVTAIGTLGMSDQSYSLLVLVSSISAVTISVSLGILSDMLGDRRHMLIAMSALGVVGYGAIYLFPSVPVFLGATSLVVPFFYATSSLLFASARLETGDLDQGDAAAVNATLRAIVSAAWVLTPAGLGLALGASGSMIGAWGLASLFCLFILICALFALKPNGSRAVRDGKTPGFFAALKELAARDMLIRMISIAAITSTLRLSGTIWPLILTLELGGKTADVGLIAGMTALTEIPFMLMWAHLLKRHCIIGIIVTAALGYGGYMVALSFAAAPWQIYTLALPGAAFAAALLAIPLNYFQDLFPGRPGLGTAFLPINSFLGNGLNAAAFAIGSHFLGYSGTAWLGLVLAVLGVVGLLSVERRVARSA
ncbi:MFS transporter [Rhizobium sp. Root274]|uniref:MFS transporter n=1 Tax=unclassified Rhizobium TaxID=2613769 RepID=UPI0007125C30|nr:MULTISPECIES: MFS transporter [unclassified Rhizobium]KQW27532.1 MFS transporter [Rhizobium sp. Root1240]KRD27769.1 MFS transporter [Rhizobium sp. Root274]